MNKFRRAKTKDLFVNLVVRALTNKPILFKGVSLLNMENVLIVSIICFTH